MSQEKIRQALESALAAMTPALETEWENVHFRLPADDVPYQKVNWLFAEPENPDLGDAHYREHGYLQVMLRYPRDTGAAAALARAELIRNTFKRGNSYQKDGITTRIERTAAIFPSIIDGDRYCVPVRVRFFADVWP